MKTIYKYPLEITDYQYVRLPIRSKIISVGNQNGRLVLWAMVDTSQTEYDRSVIIKGTGNPIESEELTGYTYIGTVQIAWLVWHVFIGEAI